MATFDAKTVTPIEWAGVGAGVLGLIASVLSWVTVSFFGGFSAWNAGFFAWFPMLMLVGAAGAVLAPHFGQEVPNRAKLWLGLSGGAAVLVLLWLIINISDFGDGIGIGVGFFLGLIAAIGSGAAAFLTFRAADKPSA
jgi:hypothetical protein